MSYSKSITRKNSIQPALSAHMCVCVCVAHIYVRMHAKTISKQPITCRPYPNGYCTPATLAMTTPSSHARPISFVNFVISYPWPGLGQINPLPHAMLLETHDTICSKQRAIKKSKNCLGCFRSYPAPCSRCDTVSFHSMALRRT